MTTYCKIFKSAKDGNVSFLVTQKLLISAYEKAQRAKKKGMLVLTIPADSDNNFILECTITKDKK